MLYIATWQYPTENGPIFQNCSHQHAHFLQWFTILIEQKILMRSMKWNSEFRCGHFYNFSDLVSTQRIQHSYQKKQQICFMLFNKEAKFRNSSENYFFLRFISQDSQLWCDGINHGKYEIKIWSQLMFTWIPRLFGTEDLRGFPLLLAAYYHGYLGYWDFDTLLNFEGASLVAGVWRSEHHSLTIT
jgi:hypothetical protein